MLTRARASTTEPKLRAGSQHPRRPADQAKVQTSPALPVGRTFTARVHGRRPLLHQLQGTTTTACLHHDPLSIHAIPRPPRIPYAGAYHRSSQSAAANCAPFRLTYPCATARQTSRLLGSPCSSCDEALQNGNSGLLASDLGRHQQAQATSSSDEDLLAPASNTQLAVPSIWPSSFCYSNDDGDEQNARAASVALAPVRVRVAERSFMTACHR